ACQLVTCNLTVRVDRVRDRRDADACRRPRPSAHERRGRAARADAAAVQRAADPARRRRRRPADARGGEPHGRGDAWHHPAARSTRKKGTDSAAALSEGSTPASLLDHTQGARAPPEDGRADRADPRGDLEGTAQQGSRRVHAAARRDARRARVAAVSWLRWFTYSLLRC